MQLEFDGLYCPGSFVDSPVQDGKIKTTVIRFTNNLLQCMVSATDTTTVVAQLDTERSLYDTLTASTEGTQPYYIV